MGKGVAARDVEDGAERGTAGAGVDADGHVEARRLPVDGEEVRIVERAVALDASEENADGAVFLRDVDLLDGRVDRPERWHRDPAQTSLRGFPDAGHEAVVGAAERDLEPGVVGDVGEEERGIDHLGVYAHRVHGLEPSFDVGELTGANVGCGLELAWLGRRPQEESTLAGRPGKDVAVDQPEAPSPVDRVPWPREDNRTSRVHRRVEEVPDRRRFEDVGVGIDRTEHLRSPSVDPRGTRELHRGRSHTADWHTLQWASCLD